VLTATAGRG